MGSDHEETIEAPETTDGWPAEERRAGDEVRLASRYRLARLMGKGGMGEVLAARDEQVGRDVAIKRMKAAKPSERAIQRFLREASIQGRLEHPAIPPVHEIGRDTDGLPFFAMKKLAGTTLARILGAPSPSFPLQRVLRAFVDVCLAVEFAHVRGVVHRDLNPNNIMLGDFGEVYVLDWGVAKVIGEDDGEFADVESGGSGGHATAAGTAIGTPGYMAPEQVRGGDIDSRADVYTLGCLLFEILAGERLHPPASAMASALAGIDARPSLRAPGREIAPELEALCVETTALDRDARLATARELGDRVQRFLDGDRDLALRRDLARQHFERARAAFDELGDEPRRRAMRETAAALALDPSLAGAAELMGRLMLEPPRATPREVDAAIAADDLRSALLSARAGMWAIIASLAFMPLLWWIAPASGGYLLAMSGCLLTSGAISIHGFATRRPHFGAVVIINAIVIGMTARMFSPLLIAPSIAAILTMAIVVTPRYSRLVSAPVIAGLAILGVLAPWILEWLGVLSRTMTVGAGGILLHAPVIGTDERPILIVGSLYVVGLIIGAAAVGQAMRVQVAAAHRRLHMQAWQLRQLVPA